MRTEHQMAQGLTLTTTSQRGAARLSGSARPVACMTRAAARWAADYGSNRLGADELSVLLGDGCGRRGWLA